MTTATNSGVRAVLRGYRMSASKVREVLDLIRGKDIISARDILVYTDRGAAKAVLKLLASAVANAEHNNGIPGDELYVAACYADEGVTMKRFSARARGRAAQILKRTSHITIIVDRMDDRKIADVIRKRNNDEAKRQARRSARVRASSPSKDQIEESQVEASEDELLEIEDVAVTEVVETNVAVETVAAESVVEADATETSSEAEVVDSAEVEGESK